MDTSIQEFSMPLKTNLQPRNGCPGLNGWITKNKIIFTELCFAKDQD
jgi:hypothetical protein